MTFDRWTYAARVVSTHDGDSVRAEIDCGFSVRVTMPLRLLGIQAPEVSGAGVTAAERHAGLAARDYLRGLFEGTPEVYVRTVRDTAEGRGRYLATVYVVGADGVVVDVCARLIETGHAVAYSGRGKAPRWRAPA